MINQVKQLVSEAVHEVFKTTLSLAIEPVEPELEALSNESHIAGAVGFIGDLTGVVYLYSTAAFARAVAGRILGRNEAEIEGEGEATINDAVGLLVQRVVERVKSRLEECGMPCALTLPSIVRGSHFSIEPVSQAERRIQAFRTNAGNLLVEVLLREKSGHATPLS
jgi:chemotaxis protein CheX